MDPRLALNELQDILATFEQALFDGEDGDADTVVQACQNFQASGQNFDDPAVTAGGEAGGLEGLPREALEGLEAQLDRLISAVELARESIQGELGGISRGRRGLRAYQGTYTYSSAQYVSTSH